MVRGGGDNFHEGRMLPHIYDEPLKGRNSPAFKSVWALSCQKLSSGLSFEWILRDLLGMMVALPKTGGSILDEWSH